MITSNSRRYRFIQLAAGSLLGVGLFAGGLGCADMVTYAKDSRREGITLYNEGAYPDAAGSFRNAIRQDPRDYKSHYYLGASYEQMKQYQQAIQAYKSSLDVMQTSLAGKEDAEFRVRVMDGLASAIAKSDDRHIETDNIERQARSKQSAENYFLLAKVYRASGDADLAVDSYNRAVLLDPNDARIAKEYGLYLEQLGQPARAEAPLRRAYLLDPEDQQTAAALRRIGVVPGPAIKPQGDLAKPDIPEGPIPQVDWSRLGMTRTQDPSQPQQDIQAPSQTPTVQAPRD